MDQLGPFQIVGAILLASGAFVAVWLGSRRLVGRLPPMAPVPVQALFSYSAFFTVGIMCLSTRASFFLPFGIVFVCLGISIFLPEKVAARLSGVFLLLLCGSLVHLLQQQLRGEEPAIQPPVKMSLWSAFVFALVWAAGILFAWHRWYWGRARKNADA